MDWHCDCRFAILSLKPANHIDVSSDQIEKETEIRDSTQINFLVETDKIDDLKLSVEHQNFAWVNQKTIGKYKISRQTKEVILKSLQILEWMEK